MTTGCPTRWCAPRGGVYRRRGVSHLRQEHLIFLGSEDFPFKGVLDTAANRLFARGTNAWCVRCTEV